MATLTDVPENPFDWYRSYIAERLAKVTGLDAAQVLPAVQRSQRLDTGDCTLAVPALRLKRKPVEVAKDIVEGFHGSQFIEPPVAQGTFIQFFFKLKPLVERVVPSILRLGPDYSISGKEGLRDPLDPSKGRKTIIIEFGSPNIAKPFHAGHLRSTIIGGFLANLYELFGWHVVRLNYLGDWGKQYGVLAVGYENFGNADSLEQEPVRHLFDVYVKISAISRDEQASIQEKQDHIEELQKKGEATERARLEVEKLQAECVDEKARRYFKRMCDGETKAIQLWKEFRKFSIAKYEQTFSRLNIHYDEYWGESQVKDESMREALQLLENLRVTEESRGALIVDLAKHQKSLGKAIVRKKDGTSIYLTRDIGGVFERAEKYHYDKMMYVIASQQDLHMAQLIKIIELMGKKDVADKLQHVNFGLVHGMSTRRGTVKFLDDILQDAGERMHEVMRSNEAKYKEVADPVRTADVLGISAVLVQDMNGKRINGYHFDMDRMTSFEGDTGPYLQYAHARLCSIIRKAQVDEHKLANADLSLLTESHARDLVRLLSQWTDVAQRTYTTQEPVTILTYLFRLTHVLSSGLDHLNVLRSEPNVKLARLALYVSVRKILQSGMRLLGLTPLERM